MKFAICTVVMYFILGVILVMVGLLVIGRLYEEGWMLARKIAKREYNIYLHFKDKYPSELRWYRSVIFLLELAGNKEYLMMMSDKQVIREVVGYKRKFIKTMFMILLFSSVGIIMFSEFVGSSCLLISSIFR